MYLQFFGLEHAPFSLESDPDFFWPGGGSAAALSGMQQAVAGQQPFTVVTGEPGSGKTLVLNRFRVSLGPRVDVAAVPNPALDLHDLYRIAFSELNMESPPNRCAHARRRLRQALYAARADGRAVVLLIDEAQRLPPALVRELARVASEPGRPLLHVCLAGQSGFPDRFEPRLRAWFDRKVSAHYRLSALTEPEVADYIRHRLKTAGTTDELFLPEAVRAIGRFSNGVPRLINRLSDYALLTAYTAGERPVGPEAVVRCAGELGVELLEPMAEQLAPVAATARRPAWARPIGWGLAAAAVALPAAWLVLHQPQSREPEAPPARPTAIEQSAAAPLQLESAGSNPLQDTARAIVTRAVPVTRPDDGDAAQGNAATAPRPRILAAPLNTAVSPPAAVAQAGTAPPQQIRSDPAPGDRSDLFRIGFRPESAEIDPLSLDSLRRLAGRLAARPGTRLTIQAWTAPGSKYARRLFEFRVAALKSYLAGSSTRPAIRIRSEDIGAGTAPQGASTFLEVIAEE